VFPGVLQVEAMAQTGGILVLNTVPDPENYTPYFVGIENCRFRRMVKPGDTIIFRCWLLAPVKRGIAKMKGQAFVNGKVVMDAEMSAAILRKDA
jgi:UDP-3-O-[3-hydroxymyristoyl] N-acetylglucosamine deacetylase/3-hydroxyacyl-[acyl-carrier-protein] dehydratase